MATAWDVPTVGWTVIVMGWLLSPIFTLLAPKILSYLCFDAKQKLKELELKIIPELQQTLQAMDEKRMMQRGDEKRMKGDVARLDKIAAILRHARYEAEDILDDGQEKIVVIDILYGWCLGIARIVRRGFLCLFFPIRLVDLETLQADLEKISLNLIRLVDLGKEESHSSRMSPVEVLRLLPKTLRADMLKTILELRRLRLEDILIDNLLLIIYRRLSPGGLLSFGQLEPAQEEAENSRIADKMVEWLRRAEEEEILLKRITGVVRSGSSRLLQWARKISLRWSEPGSAVATCIARFNMSRMWIARILRSGSTWLLKWAWKMILCRQKVELPVVAPSLHTSVAPSDGPDPVATNPTDSNEPVLETAPSDYCEGGVSGESFSVTTGAAALDGPALLPTTSEVSDGLNPMPVCIARYRGPIPVATSAAASNELTVLVAAPSDSFGWRLSCLCSSFDFFKNCCSSLYNWLVHVFVAARFYRDQLYEVLGITSIQENATALDSVLTAISRWKLKKRIEKVENIFSEVKKYPLLGVVSNITPNDIANKNRSRIRTSSKLEVFGREVLRDFIMERLHETPKSSTTLCYSVIGIYGLAGSGKTTFARYVRDYIKDECKEKLFDTILCIHVSENFSVDGIFKEMLKDITKNSHSNISDREELEEKLKKELCGKRFFLILDDLWVKNKNDPQLQELISPLNVGVKGSKILVTARTKVAARALCHDEPIKMPELDENEYLSMFMHYALRGTNVPHEEFLPVGRNIAKKLRGSPIAAVTVAGQLGANLDISYWENAVNLEMLNDTMDALWWSYQQLNPDIRRCFELCNIFPRRSKLRRDQLVHLWIAHGFVKTSCATEDVEFVAKGYIQELVSCSFLQLEEDSFFSKRGKHPFSFELGGDYFTIHDLLHDLADKVAGSDFFIIENEGSQRGEGWKGDVPRDARHLFVQHYDVELITEKILGLGNLRTLIVERVTPVEEQIIESICKRLPKLRVLIFGLCIKNPKFKCSFSFPESIGQLKHLRYLAFRASYQCTLILPSALAKCHHIQLLDCGDCHNLEFTSTDLINLRHIICQYGVKFPNIGKLISLRALPYFTVRNEQGYEVKQLRDLNKLRSKLVIYGLENVKSKEEALEANLAAKVGLTELFMNFKARQATESRRSHCDDTRCSSEVEEEVLEGMCPPKGLETLQINGYKGSRYPDWMVRKQNNGPEELQNLSFSECSQLGPGPELEAFPHLRMLELWGCSWDTLPRNVEHLTSLKKLEINVCMNIRSLPKLPQSLEFLRLNSCDDKLMESCQIEGHPDWYNLKHIPEKSFHPHIWEKRILRLDLTGLKQLRDINKLPDEMVVYGLENVKSKEEALEANLAAKEGLTKLTLEWRGGDDTRCGPEDEAAVLEGLCPPVGLQTLEIWGYRGSRHPDWMVGKQNGGPKDLQVLAFHGWSKLGPAPELEAFPHLRMLQLSDCSWDALPGSIEHLTSLNVLRIYECMNIRSLPTLPQYLEEFVLYFCDDELMKSCQTERHSNWHKIKHIPQKTLLPRIPFLEEKILELDFSMPMHTRVDINKLPDEMLVCGLEHVRSKEDVLVANLAAKEGLAKLTLRWYNDDDTRRSPEDEAEVLEGLCPPVGLETLHILCYKGSRYPDWMVGEHNGGPKYLKQLWFWRCSQLGPGPELEAFPHLHVLELVFCSWDALPGNMEHLTSLNKLKIYRCMNIHSVPTLPQSLKEFDLSFCDDELMKGCQTKGDPNWLKIKDIPKKTFCPLITYLTSSEGPSHASEAL